MTIQRSSISSRASGKQWKRRQNDLRRKTERRLNLESLEPRQLLAVGPRLAGIQANDGTLLREGQVRKTAPQELTFHFNDGANLDATTVADAIRLSRAGGDGAFANAVASTDFNTSGQVIMDFTAVNPGESGNGITLNFIKNDLGAGVLPKVTVLGNSINVELNSTVNSQTTAAQLRDTINNNPAAKRLVTASLRNNGGGTVNIAAPAITYSPLVTAGANAASVVTNLNASGGLQVKLTALEAGPSGNGIEVVINRVNFGGVSPPRVTVVDRVITVDVNSSPFSPSTAQEFANAINSHPDAGQLVRVSIPVGKPDTIIGNRVNPGTRLRLAGTRDIPIEPGFIGLGATPREVVMRFKEPLPDDLYHVEVLGAGPFALRNALGAAFGDQTEDGLDNGVDFNLNFELNLGAQVLSVVPQPIARNPVTNTLQQARNQIQVYFNDDDLWATAVLTGEVSPNPTVVDPAFYQLIFTNNSVQNTDDTIYRPKVIQYDPASDIAVLQFDKDLELLGSGPGTFRLRIGTDEALPLPPITTNLSGVAQVTTDFNTRGAATVLFQQLATASTSVTIAVSKRDLGVAGAPLVTVNGTAIQLELNSRPGSETTAAQVVTAINGSTTANQLVSASLFNTLGTGNIDVTTSLTTPISLTLREIGSSFDTALNLSQLQGQSQIISSAITPQPYDLAFPGAIDEPGHRDLPLEVQQHYLALDGGDAIAGVTIALYNFQDEYGFDPVGNVLRNAITENQKQRAREVFSLYSEYLGIQFVESGNLGMTIATGDLRALDPQATTGPGGVLGIASGGLTGTAVMDVQDFSNPGDDVFGGAWFTTAMHEIGHLLGMGYTDELPPPTILNSTPDLAFPENTVEPVFPGDADILHGKYLFRPDGKDIDLYRFEVQGSGRLSVETFAERLPATSLLDTVITLYRQGSNGQRELIARNDDYYSDDSYLELDLSPGTYWVGVSAAGNDKYDPVIEDTGLGGRSEGNYQLELHLRPNADRSLLDSTSVELDGDGDGVPGGVFNYWFRAQDAAHTLVVDKSATTEGTGSIGFPFQLISTGLLAAQPGDVVRIVGNSGGDRNPATLADNLAYEVGFNQLGQALADGPSLEVPQGVTVMVDAGAILKLRRARIGVGSSSQSVDRSAATWQVLGVPVQLDAFGQVIRDVDGNTIPGSVYFTSVHDQEIGLGRNSDSSATEPARGDWGGIDFRREIDAQDTNRFDYEKAGIFLNHVSQADIRYGGGSVLVDSIPQIISPVNMVDSRPTILFNRITQSADATMSASPDSFEETNFHSPLYQRTPFTSDYQRIGPDIHGNAAVNNSINGLFVRVMTPGGSGLEPMTVSGRWNDTDIPHILSERLVVRGTPGGHLFDQASPTVQLVTLTPTGGGQLAAGTYHYRVVFVDSDGNESAPSNATASVTIDGTSAVRSIQVNNLPFVPAGFVAKRLYRSDPNGDPNRPYFLAAELNATATSYSDSGQNVGTATRILVFSAGTPALGLRPRLDARLSIDPKVIVKLNGGAVETTLGADFYAEGIGGGEVIFTSTNDDRYGAGGTFDTNDNEDRTAATPGDWGGIFLGHGTRGSLDHAVVAFGGGAVGIEGDFSSFNAIEVHQSEARITHSLFEQNASGVSGQGPLDRAGRGFNREATIFVRAAQPIIVDNTIIDNRGSVISIDASSLNAVDVTDYGRSTFDKTSKTNPIDIVDVGRDNQGPLVRLNKLRGNDVNGLQVRGATLTTEGVWDDTDVVHVLRNETVYVPDLHTSGGLRLESSSTESLVVKLSGDSAGFTATGRPLDINDRIGGAVHLLGTPGKPVILTSLNDDTIGAGFQPDGTPQVSTGEASSQTSATQGALQLIQPNPVVGATFVGKIAVTTDGLGTDDQGLLQADIPAGSRVELAYLHVATRSFSISNPPAPGVQPNQIGFAGQSVPLSWLTNVQDSTLINFETGRADVTTLVRNIVGSGGGIFDFAVDETVTGVASEIEGTSLTVIYSNPNLPERTILVLDGGLSGPRPQLNSLLFSKPIDLSDPSFVATMALGIQFSFPSPAPFEQYSSVTVNGQPLTTSAGGYDDSIATAPNNGNLITVGGVGDSLTNPANPSSTTAADDELYDLAPLLSPGDMSLDFVTSNPSDDDSVFLLVLELSGDVAIGKTGQAGDWRSVRLDEYSNDRNVAAIVEEEGPTPSDGVGNGTPNASQFLGALAPREKSGDENLRLGFDVHGNLNQRGDADVYSFKGVAGTEVWFDIDQTRTTLDTVVELIDSSGTVLARSNDSGAEAADPTLLFRSSGMAAGSVNPLRQAGYDVKNPSRVSPFEIQDHQTINPRDAGMRVILPGTPGATATYHVRVRSNGPDLTKLAGGLTQGNYDLQIRLRELDEHPGSTVRYSDIRYATNGIEVIGQPGHSPLLGEAREIETASTSATNNDSLATAQPIGNVLQTDRGTLALQGALDLPSDVDFFQVTVDYDSIQGLGPAPHASLIFDIDYADGLARPNTTMWVFDSEGRLILRGTGSNVAEDRLAPQSGASMSDLSRGSAGPLDPYIGPVEMPAGPDRLDVNSAPPQRGVYYVAISSNSMSAQVLQQYLQANVSPQIAAVRLEPVNSVRRIAEDRIGFSGGSNVAEPPVVPVLIDPAQSPVPLHLGDVSLFVTHNGGLSSNTVSTLRLVDPFTGRPEATAGSFPEPIEDIAMRGDGNLYAYAIAPNNFNGAIQDSTTGTYVQIDTATAASTQFSDDGVETNVRDPMNTTPTAIRPNNSNGVGIEYRAMTFPSTSNSQFGGYAVGTRNDGFDNSPTAQASAGIEYLENILYNFDINTGVVRNPGGGQDKSGAALLTGAGTQKRELGEILTYTRITPQFPTVGDIFTITINGKSIQYTAGGTFGFASVQEVVAGLSAAWVTAALTVPEFAAFEVLNSTSSAFETELRVRLRDAAAAEYQIDATVTSVTGNPFFNGITVDGFGPGGVVTGIASLDGFSFYAVTDRGGLYQVNQFPSFSNTSNGLFFFTNNLASYVRNSAADLMTGANGQPIQFSGLTRGPQNVENGKYANMLFGITTDGELYAFNTEGELQPVFVDNQTSVSTGLFSVNGLAFSTLDRNLWTTTGNRGTDPGHGLVLANGTNTEPFDGSRLDALLGGTSLYFGNDRSTNQGGNQSFSNTPFVRDYNFPGGAYGSVISNPFSLKGYSAADLPVLYFNYFLESENTDYNPLTNPITLTRDSFRVFASGDDGNWTLLGTNNEFQSAVRADEFDIGPGDVQCGYPLQATEPCVQKIFDGPTEWRQARIPLGSFAGQENLRLRFDFSTAGEMNVGDTFTVGSELRAIAGKELRDGQTFTLDGSNTLEFDVGYTLVAPNGAAIQDGNAFTISTADRGPMTFEFDSDSFFARNIAAVTGRQLRDGEKFLIRVGAQTKTFEFNSGTSLRVPSAGGGQGGLRDGDSFTLDGVVFEFDTNGVFSPGNAIINLIVDSGLQVPAAGGAAGGLQDGDQLIINNGIGGPDVVFEFDSERPTSVSAGARPIDLTNIEVHVPVAGGGFGGIQDGDTFSIGDGFGGPDVVFEFDKNNNIASGNRIIPITDVSSQNDVANAIVTALQISGLGLRPVNQGGGVVRLGVFRHTVDTSTTPRLESEVISATQDEVAERLADSILNSGLGLTPTSAGTGLVRLGSTTYQVNVSNAGSIQYRLLPGSQDEVANLMVDAIRNTTLPATPVNLGSGEVFLGKQIMTVSTASAPSLTVLGGADVSDPTAIEVTFAPQDSAPAVATAISAAINGSGLGIQTIANQSVVTLPSNAFFSPNGTALTPNGVRPVVYTRQDSPNAVAANMDAAIQAAFASATITGDLTIESNDTLPTATDAGLTGGPTNYLADGFIGDNTALGLQRGRDVDVVRLDLRAGEHVVIGTTTPSTSSLTPGLRLFNAQGDEIQSTRSSSVLSNLNFANFTNLASFLAFLNNQSALIPSSNIDFNVVTSGTYYVAVSSSVNLDYNPSFEGSADIALSVPAAGGGIGGLTDGESFTITGASGTPVVFEFDTDGTIAPSSNGIRLNDVLLQVPAAGTGAGGIVDGDTFVINDNRGSGDVRFEFDTDFNINPSNVQVFVGFAATPAAIAQQIASAISGANVGLSPLALGNGAIILGTSTHTVDTSSTPSLGTSSLPRSQTQIATSIRDAIRNARLGILPTLDTTTNVILLDIRDQRVDTTLAPNLALVTPSNTGAYTLSVNVENSFDTHLEGNRLNLTGATNLTRSGLTNTFIEGQPGTIQASRTPVIVNAEMTSAEVATAIAGGIGRSTAGYVQQIVVAPGADIADGEIFAIGDGTTTVNFEFESGFSLQLPDLSIDPNAYLDGESFSISSNNNVVTFEFDDNGTFGGGNTPIRFNDLLLQIPFGGISDGNTIAVDQGLGTAPAVFEFDLDGVVQPGNQSIPITQTATQNDMANALVFALRNANVGLTPTNRGQGQVQLGITSQTVDVSNTPAITRRVILLTQTEMADKVANAILNAGLGFTPSNLGAGRIHLGGSVNQVVDVSNALQVKVIGSPGTSDPSAIVIPVFPSVATSAAQVSGLIQSAINTAVVLRGLRVTATPDGARRINLNANQLKTEFSNSPSLSLNDADESVKTYDNIVRVIGHTVSNRGPLGLESNLAGDSFGAFNTSGPPNATQYPGALRGMANAFEGVYIDDIIIGFAERGEMFTGTSVDTSFVANAELLNPQLPVGFVPHREIGVGPYQLEVRRAEAFGTTIQDPVPEIFFTNSFDTNDRLSAQASLAVPAGGAIADGQTFTLSDGLKTLVFEFEDLDLNNGVTAGRVAVGYRASESEVVIARRIRDVINGSQTQASLKVTAALSDGSGTGTTSTSTRIDFFGNAVLTLTENAKPRTQAVVEPSDNLSQAIVTGIGTDNITKFTGNGSIGDNVALLDPSSDVDLFSVRLEAGQQITVDVTANPQLLQLDSLLRVFDSIGTELAVVDDTFGLNPHIEFTAPARGTYYVGVSGFSNFFYSPRFAGSGSSAFGTFSTGPYQITIEHAVSGFQLKEFDNFGDQNLFRDQGQIVIEANRISKSKNVGILFDASVRDGATGVNAPHQGPTRLTRELNVANLVPGVVIANNVISQSGDSGIRFSGDLNTIPDPANPNGPPLVVSTAPVPFGRIVNNTIVGGSVGIQVDQNASPTLLNNILANVSTGISVDASSSTTVVGGTLFQNVATRTTGTSTGSFPIDLPAGAPLFVNARSENYYLASGSLAIDSSVNTVQDRPELVAIRSPLDFSPSPILAPDYDALGQLRVDDPSVNTPPGLGSNVFKDRGALDRADFTGPTAIMLVPGDNDPQGRDSDSRTTIIELSSQILTNFSLQLRDGLAPTDAREGTGADDNTVRGDRVTLYRDGEKLVQGLDYTFNYDRTNNILRLTPLAGIWELDRQYEIVLSNSRGVAITAPAGNMVQDGDQFQITDTTGKQVEFEFDSGYSLQVPQTLALQIPSNGGAGISDGEVFTITDGVRTERFEFDRNGATQNDVVPAPAQPAIIISYLSTDSSNEIANKVVNAIRNTSLGLLPVNVVNSLGRAVHLGSRAIHTADVSLSPSLILTGQAGGLEDGQTFSIDDGTKVVTFEFVEGAGGAGAGNRPINFSLNQTNDEIADTIVAVVKAASVGLTPTHHASSDGQVHLGGTTRHIVTNIDSQLVVSGLPGVRPAWGFKIPTVGGKLDLNTMVDGEVFIVRNGTTAVTFELDSDARSTPGNRVITFTNSTTTSQLANAIAIAIRNANLGLSPTSSSDGTITLGGTTTHSIDLTGSSFREIGLPGVTAAEPVSFIPGDYFTPGVPARTPIFSQEQMAVAIANAINNARVKTLFDKAVVATAQGGEVEVEAVVDITGVVSIFRSNITDIAGNALKANRPDGTTKFTIFIGSGLDYGDAPAPYPTLDANNGAKHQILGDFYLGASIDTDFDGQPSANADGDNKTGSNDEDGVVVTQPFTGAYGGAISVTASAAGFLDAWMDFNQDGDWNDEGEQIFASRILIAGPNALPVNVAGTAKPGLTAARFRFSSRGGLAPTGLADDGEVEDYMIGVSSNPWRNPDNGLDVDHNGFVVPQDALIVINALNARGGGPLPNPPVAPFLPPPYLDANGDGSLSPQDVLVIVNYLNSRPSGEGESAAESLSADALSGTTFVSVPEHSDDFLFQTSGVSYVDHRFAEEDADDESDFGDVLSATDTDEELMMQALATDAEGHQETDLPTMSWLLASSSDAAGAGDSNSDLWDLLAEDVRQTFPRA